MAETNCERTDVPPQNKIETLIVSVDDIVEALRFNVRPKGYTNGRTAVLRVRPAFEEASEASLYYSEQGRYSGPTPHPVHIDPTVFVDDRERAEPRTRNEYRGQAKEFLDDPSSEEIFEDVEEAYVWWEENVRNSLLSEVDINNAEVERGPPNVVTVQYKDR